jgi:hypothetical protein
VTELQPLLERVRLAVFDFDGVFTDNRVWVNERGEESLAFSRSDGLGLRRLDEVRVEYLIVSTEQNPIVGARAEKLRADCVQGVDDKLSVLRERTPSVCGPSAFRSSRPTRCLRSSRSRAGCCRAPAAQGVSASSATACGRLSADDCDGCAIRWT